MLETALAENTAAHLASAQATRDLIAIWKALAVQASAVKAKVDAAAPGDTLTIPAAGLVVATVTKETPPNAALTPAAAETVTTTPTATAPAATAAASPSEPVPTEQDVADAITALVKTAKPHVIAILSNFGVKRGSELKPEQRAAFLKALAS